MSIFRPRTRFAWATLALLASSTQAQVPPDLKPKIAAMGTVIDQAGNAALYRPLHETAPYPGIAVARDVAYGPTPRNLLDVFRPADSQGQRRTVLIYVPGGRGDKMEQVPNGEPFYDNVMLWAVKNGMVGVNMMRDSGPDVAWDAGARNIADVIAWVKQNIANYGGDPDRIFIWGHSAGAANLTTYLAYPRYHHGEGVAVKGAVLMGGPYNLAPLRSNAPRTKMILNGVVAPPAPPPDPTVLLERSVLPGLKTLDLPLLVSAAELEPPQLLEMTKLLNEQLCAVDKCPKFVIYEDHNHMSEVFAINTADESTSQPTLEWMLSIP